MSVYKINCKYIPIEICNLGSNKKAHFIQAISTKISYKKNPEKIHVKEAKTKMKRNYVEGNRLKNRPVLLLIVSSDFGLVFSLAGIKWVQDGGADQSSNGP